MPKFNVTLQLRGSASPKEIDVASLEEASRVVTEFQDEEGIGASGCGAYHGQVSTDGVLTHRIAYNGRVFPIGSHA